MMSGGRSRGTHNGPTGARRFMVQLDNVHHPRDLAGRVNIVGSIPRACGNHRGAVFDVGTDG